jgi:thioredoxin reductase (NADPH)
MAKPILLTVDDEPQVLNAVERDLRRHFRGDYRIVKAGSGREALDTVRQLQERGDQIALFLADQRMPDMTGTDFLAQALRHFPEARKVLLTAYADTQAAIDSINSVGLDYYLMKPWDPPEQNLYPVLDDLLGDWQRTVPPSFDGIRVAGTLWSPRSHDVKDFLARNRIPYLGQDIESDDAARQSVDRVNKGEHRLPVVFFPDGSTLIEPDNRLLAEKVGLRTQATQPFYDLVIVGAGPAGLGAAVYGASEGLHTLMIDKEATGGQAGTSSRIENYLGFPNGISGGDLAHRAAAQAARLGAEILTAQTVTDIRAEDPYRYITLSDGTEIGTKAIILATGVTVKRLNAPGIERLTGAGIYYGAALTEAANYTGQHVFVVGGANSAGQGAMFFSRFASQVTMLVRGEGLQASMSQYLIDQIEGTANIEVRTRTQITEAHGKDRLEALTLSTSGGDTEVTKTVPAGALFLFIGAVPHSGMVAGLVARNSAGFIPTGQELVADGKKPDGWRLKRDPLPLETSVPGIFAAGDIRQSAVRRVASAVGEGANAVSQVHQYLRTV